MEHIHLRITSTSEKNRWNSLFKLKKKFKRIAEHELFFVFKWAIVLLFLCVLFICEFEHHKIYKGQPAQSTFVTFKA